MYYKLAFSQKTNYIPIAVSLIILLFFATILYVMRNTTIFPQLQQKQIRIEKFEIGNVTEKDATVFWQTAEKTTGELRIKKEKNGVEEILLDDRDIAQSKIPRYNHFITVSNLSPSTLYYFVLVNNGTVSDIKNPYTLETMPELSKTSTLPPYYSKIKTMDNTSISDAVVIMRFAQSRPIMTLTGSKGGFLLSLCCMRDISTGNLLKVDSDTRIDLELIDENKNSLHVLGSYDSLISYDKSFVLKSKSDRLVLKEKEKPKLIAKNNTTNVLGAQASASFSLIYPKENAVIPGRRPLIKGTAEKNSTVTLSMLNNTKINKVTSDNDGIWSFIPTFDFPQGKQSIQVSINSQNTKVYTIKREFTIAKSGEVVLGDATASATLTPTTIASATPTIISVDNPTPIATLSATPTRILPPSGLTTQHIGIISASLIFLGIGILFVF